MNNRFNFRMWDINTKRFYYMYLDELIGLTRTISIPKDATIQQYTGLTDKNDKEIFEGDIIIDTQKQKYEIIFYENHARYDLKVCGENKLSQTSYFTQIYEKKHIEVIGNIFEHSELLK
jgi:uncharacterized phage protein (TIGR01671 family)